MLVHDDAHDRHHESQCTKLCTTLPLKHDWRTPKNRSIWDHDLAPAQRAVGDCPPPKEIPDEGARRRRIFFYFFIKINDFLYEICLVHRFYRWVFDRIWSISMKNIWIDENLRKFWKIFWKFSWIFRSRKKIEKFFDFFFLPYGVSHTVEYGIKFRNRIKYRHITDPYR